MPALFNNRKFPPLLLQIAIFVLGYILGLEEHEHCKFVFSNPVQNYTLQSDLYPRAGDLVTGSRSSISWATLLTYLLIFMPLWYSITSISPSCPAPARILQAAALISPSLWILTDFSRPMTSSFPDHVEKLFSIPELWGLSSLCFISRAQVSLLNSLHAPLWAILHTCLVSAVPYSVLEHHSTNAYWEIIVPWKP